MAKYKLFSVVKNEEGNAVLEYTYKGQATQTVNRQLQEHKGEQAVLFKGVRFIVTFNENGQANSIKALEVYDTRLKNGNKRLSEEYLSVENKYGESHQLETEVVTKATPKPSNDGTVKHYKYDEIKTYVDCDIPVYLFGPAGSGKNHVLQQMAEELGLDFYFTNSVQQEFKITGFIDAGGNYHETEFYKAFKNGGLFFLDELDASIPEVLVLLNAALANRYFEFPTGKVNAHPDFRVVAAGNTVGSGADEQYTGRLQLDSSTLDRFAMIEFTYDRNIELLMAKGDENLVQFVRSLRRQAFEKGINAIFSYRCISMVAKLAGKLELHKIIESSVVKGLDKDTIKTFDTTSTNPYSKALWVLQQKK